VAQMLDLGFGFVEIGTVTPEAQAGNPKPRMFRLTQDLGIVNRYGFNSQGAAAVEANLQAYRQSPVKKKDPEAGAAWKAMRWLQSTMYPEQHAAGVVGVNIGKNKETEDSAADYVSNITRLGVYADYLVVNISSPNTAGLRELQQADALRSLLQACLKARDALEVPVPLLVKLAPDLTEDDLQEIANVLLSLEIDGIVVTNTTKERPRDLISKHRGEIGGLSGAPVKDKSTEVIRQLFRLTRGKIPIIGVGGVGTGHDAYVKLKAGASLVQVYSMMVYKGPGLVSQIRHELAKLMLQNGQRSIEDVVGSDPCHEDIFWKKKQAAGVQKVQEMEETFAINQ
jgi:dihydroorotate dehydrogenase